MEEKFSFKLVVNGQTQLSRQVRSGAGANGQALVVKAQEAAHYQLINLVTLSSPAKMQLKRKGDDLQLSLPGGDAESPDVIIQDYFAVASNQLQGISQNGEWMSYDTTVFLPKPPTANDKTTKPLNPDSPVAIGLAEPPMALMSKFDSPMGLAAIGGGVVVLGSLARGDGGSSPPAGDAFTVFKSYASASASSATAPTAAQYTAAGVSVPTVDGVTAANVLAGLNLVVSSKSSAEVASKEQLQKIADALKTSWALIIAEANGSTADATPNSAPTASDYLNVGVTVGTTTKALDLMNSALAELSTTSVDSTAKIKDLATAADKLMKVAAGTSGASLSSSDLTTLGLEINGVNAGITSVQADAFSKNLANLQTALGKTNALTSGAEVSTLAQVQALFSLQVMRSYNDDTASTKTQPAPGISDYTNIGIQSFTSSTDATRIPLDASNFANVNLQTSFNSALDNQASGTALTKDVIQNMVDAYFHVLKEAGSTTSISGSYVNDASNDPTLTDYTRLGITHVDKSALSSSADSHLITLLNNAVGRLSASAVDTTSEIQAMEKAAENIFAAGSASTASYTTDTEWLSGFSLLGVTGVTASNLASVKADIHTKNASNDLSAIDTVQALQAIVSMQRLNDYAYNDTINPLPTLADYQAILDKQGVSFLNNGLSANLSAYNDAVRVKSTNAFVDESINGQTVTAESKVVDMVKSFDKILKYADGSINTYLTDAPTKSDFLNVGVGTGMSTALKSAVTNMLDVNEYTNLLADVVGGRSSSQVSTISQLNDLAAIVERISELEAKTSTSTDKYTSITGGALSVDDFDKLGLDTTKLKDTSGTTLQNRLNYIYDNLIKVGEDPAFTKAQFDSLLELNALIKAAAFNFP